MLLAVLLCVLIGLGTLLEALLTGQGGWAWASLAASAAAAALLGVDGYLRRRRVAVGVSRSADRVVAPDRGPSPAAPAKPVSKDPGNPPADHPGTAGPESPDGVDGGAAQADPEPGEEDTDAADALLVADLPDEVRVVDERPRYHLATCGWLTGRETLALPVGEARELGFSPCARCTPDAVLAGRHRRR